MTGKHTSKEVLNKTLLFVLKLLREHQIKNWFVGYGTLLGIVREDTCIHNDDDVDILVDHTYYDALEKALVDNGFSIERGYPIYKSRNILKTKSREGFASMDFYMAVVDDDGNFCDPWEEVIWSGCYDETGKLVERRWNDEIVYLPFNAEEKLENRYGESWRIPQNSKGPRQHKKVL